MVEIPHPKDSFSHGEDTMPAGEPIDLNQMLLNQAVQNHQLVLTESQGNIQNSNNLARLTGVKKFDEIQAIESSAVGKVLNHPTNQNPVTP